MPERADKKSSLCRVVGLVLSALLLTGLSAGTALSVPAPPAAYSYLRSEESTPVPTPESGGAVQDFGALTPGEVVRREMGGGQTHSYHVALAEGQFFRVIVEQQGVDVEVKILGPASGQVDQQTAEADSPNGLYGPESVSIISRLKGVYSIEIRFGSSIPAGGYELKTDGPREPTEADRDRVSAEALFAEGQKLRFQGKPESLREAVEKYTESLALWEKLGDAHGRAYTTCNIGRTYKGLCDIPNAIANLNHASSILREAQDGPGEAWMLNEIGAIYRNLGDSSQALEPYKRALQLRLDAGDTWGQAQILNNLGLAYANMGRHQQAVDSYQRAIQLWQAVQERPNEINTLNNLYLSSSELGDITSALANFQQLKSSCQDSGQCKGSKLEAYVHNNIGKILDTLSESQAALGEYRLAQEIFQKRNSAEDEAMVLDNIGMVYAGLGDATQALENFFKSLDIRDRTCSARGRGITNTNIGYAYAIKGEPQTAIKYFDRALPLNREAQNLPFVAYALVSKGMARASLLESQAALDLYGQALSIQTELGDTRGQAITLEKIGQVYAASRAGGRALDSYRMALGRWRDVKDRQGEALTLYDIARAERDIGSLDEARKHVEEAIGIVESLRATLLAERLRLNYFATKQDFYELDVDVRMRLFDLTHSEEHREAAIHASERARARGLLELLAEARADIHKEVSPLYAERAHSLEREINALTEKLIRARNLRLSKDVAKLEARFEASANELDDLHGKIRAGNKSYAGLKQPEPLRLKQIQQLLDDDTLLLEYSLGERRSYLWAVTRTDVESHTLPARPEVVEAVNNLRTLLTAYQPPGPGENADRYLRRIRESQSQYWRKAAELSGTLLGPVSSRLRMSRIVIIADGALMYIPFEALPLPQPQRAASPSRQQAGNAGPKLLAADHEILYEPSATALALLRETRRGEASGTVAVLADPVYSTEDDRVKVDGRKTAAERPASPRARDLGRVLRDVGETGAAGGAFKLERLRHSAEEANSIISAAPDGSWLEATGFKANRETVLGTELRRYSVVHFATHGFFDEEHPELSGVVLSLVNERGQPEDGFLGLSDVYDMKLSADLVVLSACRTGLGKNVKGEGLIGLTRGFMHAGAKRVLASLWQVDDEATAELMKRFYRHMLKDGMPAAAALKLAKSELMQAREQWRAPYFWAGFILQGDWK
jgi:CHAT domain-containing protein/Flp pilus assembly protein TadD